MDVRPPAPDPQALLAENVRLRSAVVQLQAQVRALQDLTRRLLRGRFGAKTEAMIGACLGQAIIVGMESLLSAEQQAAAQGRPDVLDPVTGVVTPGLPAAPVTAEQPAAPVREAAAEPPLRAKRTPRRNPAAWSERHPELPVDMTVLQPAADDLVDSDGRAKVRIGEETTETLAIDGPHLVVKRIVRPRYASAATSGERVIAALPERITPAGSLDDSAVHHLMEQRYGYSVPFFRSLSMIAALGVHLPRSTVNGAAADWARIMQPLADAIRADLWKSPLLFVDHAIMRQQDHDRDGTCARIPVFTATDGEQSWYYAPPTLCDARGAEVLEGYAGKWIADDWSGWNKNRPSGGCNAHGRRPFAELQTVSTDAGSIVQRYGLIYRHEARIADDLASSGLTGQAKLDAIVAERQRHCAPIMAGIHDEAERIAAAQPPKTTLGNGARYLLRCWPKLTAFLNDGLLLPDNNTAERALRLIALNRKNSLFLGVGEHAPQRAAIAWTIFGSCRQLAIPATRYLTDITPELHAWHRAKRDGLILPDLARVTPRAWAARQPRVSSLSVA